MPPATCSGPPFLLNNDAVYEIPQNGASIASVPKTLATFGGAATQQDIGEGGPYGGLVMDRAGNLFGTTTDGNGSVFEIAYTGAGQYATATTIATFSGSAAEPLGNLIMDASGDLFGTTATGGGEWRRPVFEIKFANGSYASTPTTLYSFTSAADGDLPAGGLVMDANGNLFGTTSGGGTGVSRGGPFKNPGYRRHGLRAQGHQRHLRIYRDYALHLHRRQRRLGSVGRPHHGCRRRPLWNHDRDRRR